MKKLLFVVFLALTCGIALLLWWVNNDMQDHLRMPLDLPEDGVLVVEAGKSLKSLAAGLVEKGWLEHPHYFIFEGRRQKKAALIKTGEYIVPVGTTPLQLLDILVAGKVKQYSITLPEGLTFKQILELLKLDKQLVHTLNHDDPKWVMAELGYAGYFAEGRIYPDTYLFPAGTTDIEFLQRAIKMQETVLREEWKQRLPGLPYESPYQALIMASIIEKETGIASERGKIAGVFVRRLLANMKLQTDPTVIYAMSDNFDGDIRRKDLSIDSPYNTYVYRGLPPTPIASPGRDAIHAALNPEPGRELYFVAKGDGSHYFSESLREHNDAVARYQLKKR